MGEPDKWLEDPLVGVRVVEPGQLLAGPFTTSRLADFGAEVIKLETPKLGIDLILNQLECLLGPLHRRR